MVLARAPTQRLVPEWSQNSLTARRFILNSLAVQKPHCPKAESEQGDQTAQVCLPLFVTFSLK
jgi:hypothetical protein